MSSMQNAEAEWINATDAGKILGINAQSVRKIAERGRITQNLVPNCRRMFRKADVLRLAKESIKPALVQTSAH